MTNATKPIQTVIDALEDFEGIKQTDEAVPLALLKTAHKFAFDADALPRDLWSPAFMYGMQLAEHGRLRLPFPQAVFQVGPYTWDPEPDDPPESETAPFWYVVAAWMDGDTVRGRMYYRAGAHGANTNRATFGYPNGMNFKDWVMSDDPAYCKVDARPIVGPGALHNDYPLGPDGISAIESRRCAKSFWAMHLMAAIGCLNTTGIETSLRPAPVKLNAVRAKKGKPPIFEYRFVTVDPALLRMPGVRRGGTHASPRLHWRRGHERTVAPGRKVWINAVLVGDPERGFIHHDYRTKPDYPAPEIQP